MKLFTEHKVKQFWYSFFPVVLPLVSGFIIHLLMAKSISPQDYSVIPQALALVGLATTIAYMINHDVAIREIAITEDPQKVIAAFFAGRVLFTLIGAMICLVLIISSHAQGKMVKMLFALWFVANVGLNENLSQVSRSKGKYGSSAYLYIINFLLLMAGTIYIYFHNASPLGLGTVFFVSSLITALIFSKQILSNFKRPKLEELKNIFIKSLPIAISGFALFISNWFGVLYLSVTGANDDMTYYFLAGKFAGAHLILLSILYFAYIPSLSKMNDIERNLIFKRWLAAIGLYALISAIAVAYLVIPLFIRFWGSQYQKIQIYYLYYLPWIIFACLSYYFGLFIYADGKAGIIGRFQMILAVFTAFCVIFSYRIWGALSLPLAEGLAMMIAGASQYYLWIKSQRKIKKY